MHRLAIIGCYCPGETSPVTTKKITVFRPLDISLQRRHNGLEGVSNHQPYDCLPNRLFGRRSQKTSKLRVTGLCAGNSPVTGEFLAQRASIAENVPIWWRHHAYGIRAPISHHRMLLPWGNKSGKNKEINGFPTPWYLPKTNGSWWRHQMEIFSALLALWPSVDNIHKPFHCFIFLHFRFLWMKRMYLASVRTNRYKLQR